MNFAEKAALFRKSRLTPDQILAEAALAELGVVRVKFLRNVMFEAGASLGSGSPSATTRALVGSHSYMNDGGYFRGRVIIGRYASIGRRVTIGAGTHLISGLSSSPKLSGGPPEHAYTSEEIDLLGTIRPSLSDLTVDIGHDVWVGDGATIMPGRSIGVGAVIGANAVVTKAVRPYEIVAGVPARKIGQRFPDEIVQALLQSEWWERPFEDLRQLPLGNILRCLPLLSSAPVDIPALPTYALQKRAASR